MNFFKSAVLFKQKTSLKILDLKKSNPSSHQVLVKIKVAGICGSDLHYFRHGGSGSFKQPLPMDMGHEPSGEVIDSIKSDLETILFEVVL